ncbi:MAG TPA: ABC transporter substrate-binding protein [Xanthobacteraceae bacterium]|jgi:ABC-type nitrate/sulfonate/bicarbonate transport system substrate-binding protein
MVRILGHGRLLAALAITVGSIIAGWPPAVAATLTVGKAAPNADPIIPVNVGDKLGIFKKHGLELTIVDFTGGSKMTQAMAAGSIDIGVGAGTEMALVAKGAPMTAICESAGPPSFLSIGVPWDSPIRSLDQLRGKRIGVSSAGSLTDWLAKDLARKKGWGPQGITVVTMGNAPSSIIAAFREHLVDAYVNVISLFLAMEENKTGRVLAPVSQYEGKLAVGALYASKHLIDSDPEAVRAFVAGWIETIDFIRTHKAETVKIESEITGFPESVMSKDYDITVGMFTKDCRFDPESLATLKRSFVDLKLLPAPPDMSALYTEAFLPK